MSGLFETFGTNAKLEREGKWFEFVGVTNPDKTTPGFLMARMAATNPAYQAAIEKHSRDLRQAIDLDTLTENVAGPVMRSVFVDTILLDWRFVPDVENPGGYLAYSKEAARKLIDDTPNLYFALVEEAKKLGNFRNAELEAVSGELSKPSEKRSDNESI